MVDQTLPKIAWCFGPGADGGGHSFTLSPEGNPYLAFLLSQIVKGAPELDGWTFYDSRQASPQFSGMKMDIAGESVSAAEIWLTPTLDHEREEIDLVCWAPVFETLPESQRGHILFLWLDEAIGEFQVGNRLGKIEINPTALQDAIPLSELPDFIAQVEVDHDWERKTPGEYFSSYRMPEPNELTTQHLRSDLMVGTSLLYQLSGDFAAAGGAMEHPAPDLGVDFIFVRIPREDFTEGCEIDQRADLEDALAAGLSAEGAELDAGAVLGGASGQQWLYIDLALFDAAQAMPVIRKVLNASVHAQAAEVYYFDRERAGRRIA